MFIVINVMAHEIFILILIQTFIFSMSLKYACYLVLQQIERLSTAALQNLQQSRSCDVYIRHLTLALTMFSIIQTIKPEQVNSCLNVSAHREWGHKYKL